LLQKFSRRDFGATTLQQSIIIFFLTSFFINSIHQLVAVEDRCTFSMKNGRENRNNGNQEKGKEEKEALRKFGTKVKRGRDERPLSFWSGSFPLC
jgi:hypothetical protein